MIRLLLLFILVAGGNANVLDCMNSKCGNPFNATTVGTQFKEVYFYYSPGFGPQNIVGTFHNGVELLNFYGNELKSFDGTNLKNSNIKTL